MFLISPGDRVQLGSLGESPHPTPLAPDFTPRLRPPGVLTQAGPPSAFVTHCSQLYCNRPHFTWPHWDIWSSSGCHLFLREGDRSQNWDPWYAHLSAALVAAHHMMWQTKLCTQYYLKFPIKDVERVQKVVIRFCSISFNTCVCLCVCLRDREMQGFFRKFDQISVSSFHTSFSLAFGSVEGLLNITHFSYRHNLKKIFHKS